MSNASHLLQLLHEITVEESLRIAASVFANAQEGIVLTDAGGFITDVNPTFSRITGYARDEVLGRTPRLLGSGHQDAAFYRQLWATLLADGHWRGEIRNRNKAGEVYADVLSITAVKDAGGQISHYIGAFSGISQLQESEVQLDRLVHYDPLTGLPNRRLLTDRLRQALAQTQRTGKIMAICVLDLDNFQTINTRLGVAAGDQMLVEIARRLTAAVRDFDTVARRGSDEFVLLLNQLEWVEECDGILSRLLAEVAAPLPLAGQTVQVSASLGVTLFPQDRAACNELLAHAEHACALAQAAGGSRYQLFNAEHDRLVRDYRRLVEDLVIALEQGQFVLHYQPKVNMAADLVMGVEALIRWQHPERGLLAPAEFLYATAPAGLDILLDNWVIDHALKQLSRWAAQGLCLPVSINLSPRSLLDEDFVTRLADALTRHLGSDDGGNGGASLSGNDFELEILESARLVKETRATANIKACQALGIRVALDDFGTGHTALADFRRLPADVLKIDRSIVRDIGDIGAGGDSSDNSDDLAIVEGIIKIARGFNREVIAKGVESRAQADQLMHLGCHVMQGHAIARPMPADALAEWLASRAENPGDGAQG